MNPMRMRPVGTPPATGLDRREFLKVTAAAGAGLTLGFWSGAAAAQASGPGKTVGAAAAGAFAPNAFLTIGTDNTVTVYVKHLEMGQGTYTGLPTLVAEELDAAWSQIRAAGAPADASRYANLFWGNAQGTGGSTALANSFEQYRQAGAAARAMLVAAAAKQWNVPADSIQVKNGVVFHASGRKATFGALARAAAAEPVPASVRLKDPKDYVYIGKHVPRTDSKAKSNGTAQFTQDVKLPDMLTAVVAHSPRFGARVKSYDAAGATKLPGVRYVVEVPNGIAVVATSFWAAKTGRDALRIEWDDASGFKRSSDDLMAEYRRLAGTPGKVARTEGDAAKAIAGAARKLEATYEFPYLAHAPMEPMDLVIRLGADTCEIWNGEQFQTGDQHAVAQLVGLKPEQVKLNMLYAGGSFGRRANPAADYLIEAATIAKAIAAKGGTGQPVKLVWTREDDMRAGYYRPAYVHALSAGLDGSGNVAGWQHRIVGQSILAGTPFEKAMVKDGIDATSVEGASTLPYSIADLVVDLHSPNVGVPVLWWRSVGSTHTAFSTETFIDELAQSAGKDPVAFRRALLGKHPRHLRVLELAAAKSGWGTPLAPGKAGEKRGRGVAVHESFNTFVAQVAEVTVGKEGTFRVDRVVCAVDCGVAVNPDVIRAQMEGGIGFGLSAALYGKITLKDGVVEQSNFHDYRVLRIDEMPAVEVHIVPSAEKPSGVGEPGVPVIAPAVANALAAATGQRLRTLPLKLA
ncbi:MAG TPA: xanthine dehydrogenase family protein molybdopterin-binding subunit [Casimicrobiaceae bacterium]|nr:xanthine dehydrogenase family protein molybdopterin-binding subunit [Casimicrobiaceae bacterium]